MKVMITMNDHDHVHDDDRNNDDDNEWLQKDVKPQYNTYYIYM